MPDGEYVIPIGKADLKRSGTDVTLITWSRMLTAHVLPAAELLAQQGINAEVVDLRTLKPFDQEAVAASVRKTNRAVVVDESWPMFSVASEVAYGLQRYAFDHLDAPVVRVNGRDVPMAYASTLVAEYLPNPERVINAVKAVMYR